MWRHAERPLQLTSKLNLRSTFRSDDDSFSDSFETGSALFGVRYLLTDALNVSGELGYQAKGSSQDKVEHGVRELVAGSYAPGPLDFRSFDYTYSGSLSGQNDSFDTGSSRQGLQGFARHGLSRSRPSNAERPTYLSFDVNQSIGGRADTDERDDFNLTHRAAFSWGRRASAQSTQLRTWFLDTRRLIGIVSDSQTFNLTLSHNHSINAISDWALSTTTSAIRSGKSGTGSRWGDSPYVDVDAEYRHRRLFGIPRLSFRSTLRFNTSRVGPFDLKSGGTRLSFENRFDYYIGLVNIQLRIINVNPGSRALNSFFLMVSRSF
ncbi:MAG: hypothetical protein JRG94_26495 [Deltaproteobacteria bacterium]|nr:hypothetical protein [Deltaproteobacteria bacterium]